MTYGSADDMPHYHFCPICNDYKKCWEDCDPVIEWEKECMYHFNRFRRQGSLFVEEERRNDFPT